MGWQIPPKFKNLTVCQWPVLPILPYLNLTDLRTYRLQATAYRMAEELTRKVPNDVQRDCTLGIACKLQHGSLGWWLET